MNATVQDKDGNDVTMLMGCYGIGVTRIVGAAIEQNHDERGIIWPEPLTPFDVVLIPDQHAPLGKTSRSRRKHCTANSGVRGWTSCSMTATRGPASSLRTPNSSVFRIDW